MPTEINSESRFDYPETLLSTGQGAVNDKLEAYFYKKEEYFGESGVQFGFSVLTGLARSAFGCAQIVASVALVLFKFLLEVPYRALWTAYEGDGTNRNQQATAMALNEGAKAFSYPVHGIANLIRGLFETFQFAALYQTVVENCCSHNWSINPKSPTFSYDAVAFLWPNTGTLFFDSPATEEDGLP